MSSLAIIQTFRSALSLYREALPLFTRRVLPLVILAEAIDAFDFSTHSPYFILAGLASWVLMAFANAHGLRLMLQARHMSSGGPLTVVTFVLFMALSGYIMVATALAAFLLLVPAFTVIAATALSPVFVLDQQQGPFEAIASSAECTKGNLFRIACIIVLFWLALIAAFIAIAIAADLAGPLSRPIVFVASVAMAFLGFFHYAVVVVLFEHFHPNIVRGALHLAAERPST